MNSIKNSLISNENTHNNLELKSYPVDKVDKSNLSHDDIVKNTQSLINSYLTLYSKEICEVEFSWKYFIKTFFYHILYYFALGPLSLPLLIYLEGYIFVRNMNFIKIDIFQVLNFIMYLSCGGSIILLLFFDTDNTFTKYSIEISLCWVATFIRCLMIAGRYGYTTEFMYKYRQNNLLDPKIEQREYLLGSWKDPKTEVIDIELMESLTRLNMKVDNFFYTNIYELTDEYKDILSDINTKSESNENYIKFTHTSNEVDNFDIIFNTEIYSYIYHYADYIKSNNKDKEINPKLSSQHIIYPSYLLIKELILKSIKFSKTDTINFLIPLYIVLPFILRLFKNGVIQISITKTSFTYATDFSHFSSIFGSNPTQVIILLSVSLSKLLVFHLNILMVLVGILCIQRKSNALLYLENLINPLRSNQNFPLINIFCIQNITSWETMRKIIYNFSLRYTLRTDLYCKFFIFLYGTVFLFLYLSILGPIKIQKIEFYLYMSFECLIAGYIIMKNLHHSIQLNNTYESNKKSLLNLKLNITRLKMMNKDFFVENKDDLYYIIGRKVYENYLLNNKGEQFFDVLAELETVISEQIERINLEEQNESLKIFGIKLTDDLYIQFNIILLTFIYGVFYSLLDYIY